MTVLRLERCENCTSLSSLGLLSLLKDLTITGMNGLKSIGCEIYGEGCSKPFPSLNALYFTDLREWERWEPIKANEQVEAFPCLRNLSIVNCPKLSRRLPDHLPSLEKLVIKDCKQFVVSVSSFPMLSQIESVGCKEVITSSLTDYLPEVSDSVEYFRIWQLVKKRVPEQRNSTY
ncbi:hypothetical protein Dsin_023529 [Dipteronia sinensis]|uniref:Uncharacterized protein n=1 Tax=Dipteronia sinensis TaxID=43782 RepID=A0AAE0A4L7_9ROSI|nr:hypothetical protein Dsin_023529 [Dipteronia sinensis]